MAHKEADHLKRKKIKAKRKKGKRKKNNPMAKLLSQPNFQQRKVKSKKLYNKQQAKFRLLNWDGWWAKQKCRLKAQDKNGIFLRTSQKLPSVGQRNMATELRRKKAKRTWVKAKVQSLRIVGDCCYCSREMTNDESFVVFASTDKNGNREKAHYDCMKYDDEKKNKSKFDW